MSDEGVVGVVLTNERYQMLVADAASGEESRRLADDFDARIQRLTQERDAARRELAERDEREREAAAELPEAVRAWRGALNGDENRAWAVDQLRRHPGIGAGILAIAADALEALATAPATAIAAVLPATAEDVAVFRKHQVACRIVPNPTPYEQALGRAIIVAPCDLRETLRLDDVYRGAGGGHLAGLRAVATGAIAHDRQRRAEQPATSRAEPEKYLRCEACGHEESEPFAPGDSHAGCDGPLLCVTCGTGIATSRAEPDEAMVERLMWAGRNAHEGRPFAEDPPKASWRRAVRAILAELAATDSDLARRLAECEAERDRLQKALTARNGEVETWMCDATEAQADRDEWQRKAERAEARAKLLEVERDNARMTGDHWHERALALKEAAHPEPAEAPLVDVVGRILRDTLDHEPDFRRAAERVVAEVERRLPTVEAFGIAITNLRGYTTGSEAARRALPAIRTRLGLDAAAPDSPAVARTKETE